MNVTQLHCEIFEGQLLESTRFCTKVAYMQEFKYTAPGVIDSSLWEAALQRSYVSGDGIWFFTFRREHITNTVDGSPNGVT